MNQYHWLTKEGRRDLLLFSIFLTLAGLLSWLFMWLTSIKPPVNNIDRLIFSPIGAIFIAAVVGYFIGQLMPPVWGVHRYPSKHNVKYIFSQGRIRFDQTDVINSPEFRRHLDDIKRLEREGKIGPLQSASTISGVEQCQNPKSRQP